MNTHPFIDQQLVTQIEKNKSKIIVLDDDPTGIQTVHDIMVYTDWKEASIRQGFLEQEKMFFILTNSRGMTREQTRLCHEQIVNRVVKVSKELGISYILISRSDSTLRGHYPLETEVLSKGIKSVDGEIICPFFKEGGRFTIQDTHYVKMEEKLVPVGNTEFARDKTFGYHSSNLKDYVEEKTKGAFRAADVLSISLDDLRQYKVDKIYTQLMSAENFVKIIINATDYIDLKVFVVALYQALESGKTFLYRVAAGFVKVLGLISDQALLNKSQMISVNENNGGIIIVGSHTRKTTTQLEELKKVKTIKFIEFNSDLVLDEAAFQAEVKKVIEQMNAYIKDKKNVALYTKRKLLTVEGDTEEEVLIRSVKISDALQSIVAGLSTVPSFIVAKGGITSYDVGVKALGVKRAKVLGQIQPGIPVWKTDSTSKFPEVPYIIFPGNVGDAETLKQVVETFI